jgi:hypothetical protein
MDIIERRRPSGRSSRHVRLPLHTPDVLDRLGDTPPDEARGQVASAERTVGVAVRRRSGLVPVGAEQIVGEIVDVGVEWICHAGSLDDESLTSG